jgi:hypothetical protein
VVEQIQVQPELEQILAQAPERVQVREPAPAVAELEQVLVVEQAQVVEAPELDQALAVVEQVQVAVQQVADLVADFNNFKYHTN